MAESPPVLAREPTIWRIRRWAVRAAGVLLLGVGVVFVASIGTAGLWHLLVGAGFYAVALALLLSRWARRRSDSPVGHLTARKAARGLLVLIGAALVVWASVLAAVTVHPVDPTVLSTHSSCGSTIWPRRFPAPSASQVAHSPVGTLDIGLAQRLGASLSSSDCGDGIGQQRNNALVLAEIGLLLLWAALLRPLPTNAVEPDHDPSGPLEPVLGDRPATPVVLGPEPIFVDRLAAPAVLAGESAAAAESSLPPPTARPRPRQWLLPHRWVMLGAIVATAAVLTGAIAVHTQHQVQSAETFDRQAGAWLATYPQRLDVVGILVDGMVTPLKSRDYATLNARCTTAQTAAGRLDGAGNALPAVMGPAVAQDLRAFVSDIHTAFAACITGSQSRDWDYLKLHMRPALVAASGELAKIQGRAAYR